jgi:predicted nucleic-acid-binding Zn-ribbon protein
MIKQILHSIPSNFVRIIGAIVLVALGVGMLVTSVPLFAIIAFGAAIWLIYSVVRFGIDDWNAKKSSVRHAELQLARREKAQLIVSSGGPTSLEDYLFLFPDACPKCGSRNLSRTDGAGTSANYADPHDVYEIGLTVNPYSIVACRRCNHVLSESYSPSYVGGDETSNYQEVQDVRVNSPYLSKEVADKIPEFPYESS